MGAVAVVAGALIGAAAGVYQGERSAQVASKGRRLRERAQRDAEARAISTKRQERQRIAKEDAKVPDASTLLSDAQKGGGLSNTLLSGAGGVDPGQLKIGRSTLLGE